MVRESNGMFVRSTLGNVCDAASIINAVIVCLKDKTIGDYIILKAR